MDNAQSFLQQFGWLASTGNLVEFSATAATTFVHASLVAAVGRLVIGHVEVAFRQIALLDPGPRKVVRILVALAVTEPFHPFGRRVPER